MSVSVIAPRKRSSSLSLVLLGGGLTGALDRQSASLCLRPDLCTIVTSNSCSRRLQRARRPDGSFRLASQQRAWWSVTTRNGIPYRYGRNLVSAQTTARHSLSVVE
uniref:Putative secreted protein n=1 Tax=Ixodes ricinus TaxID=34613 RepID=A0A6B0UGM3_IXORI